MKQVIKLFAVGLLICACLIDFLSAQEQTQSKSKKDEKDKHE